MLCVLNVYISAMSILFLPQFLFAVLAAETGFVKNEFISCHSFHWVNWFQTG